MAIFISGHDRSGTTLLQQLCLNHPEMMVTNEFNLFIPLGLPFSSYARSLLHHLLRIKNRYKFNQQYQVFGKGAYTNFPFTISFLRHLMGDHSKLITVQDVEKSLKKMTPQAKVVGDKKTIYNTMLPELVQGNDLRGVIIYRDCRDVTSSFLILTQTIWRKQLWVQEYKSAQAIARRWVQWMDQMEQYADHLYIMRYESLVHEPQRELQALAQWLGIGAEGFQYARISPANIGKYNKTLSADQLSQIHEIAGPMMARYDYL